MDILQLVDQLEDVLNQGWRVPFTSTLLVNEEACLRIIDQLRVSAPREISQAQRVLQEKERLVAEAEREAQRIIARAREEAARIAQGGKVVVNPQEQSRAIVAEAERQAKALTDGANQYAREVLEGLRDQLEALLSQVRGGIAYLESSATTRPSPRRERR